MLYDANRSPNSRRCPRKAAFFVQDAPKICRHYHTILQHVGIRFEKYFKKNLVSIGKVCTFAPDFKRTGPRRQENIEIENIPP